MQSESQIVAAMQEWKTTEGLHPAEINVIDQLERVAALGWWPFIDAFRMFTEVMPDVIQSAVMKARTQGRCKEWPDA